MAAQVPRYSDDYGMVVKTLTFDSTSLKLGNSRGLQLSELRCCDSPKQGAGSVLGPSFAWSWTLTRLYLRDILDIPLLGGTNTPGLLGRASDKAALTTTGTTICMTSSSASWSKGAG